MASSSNSIIQCNSSTSSSSAVVRPNNHYYDVFVSFRGEDTRLNFTGFLFAALRRKFIVPFRDDNNLQKGEFIAPELLRAIEASHVYVVVFSKNYASSTWCLGELEYILECVRGSGKHVLPVFYDVDPSDVRKQSGTYAEHFAKHEERFKQDLDKVHRWREALKQVAHRSGWDVRYKLQSSEVEKIAQEITKILGHKVSTTLSKDLVGMESPIEELENLLILDSVDNVRVVGITGMGGIGKTTLAKNVYGRIFHQFDARCLIDDVSKIYRDDGSIGAQKLLLHQTLREENLCIYISFDATNLIQSRLSHSRALIILDNVDKPEQPEKLALRPEWLGPGSRIIIISRDKHILKNYGVDAVYEVEILSETDSRLLFSRKAFKLDHIISNFEKLAYDILNYANGLPLAIEVLGSYLFGRYVSEWISALARLRESPNKDIMDVLRLSFDGLEKNEKEIFLDIACFFIDVPFDCVYDKKYVKNVLDCCGFHPDIGMKVLSDKSLISLDFGRIIMHPLLVELGRKIIQENSTKEPRKWSRLWLDEQFYNVMSENMEKNVEAIVLWTSERKILMAEALSKMSHLRLLVLCRVDFIGSLNCLSNELRYVDWYKYPLRYLPSSFQPNSLGALILEDSNIKQLWEGKKYLPNLRTLNLRNSKNLIKIPDFEEVPNLEELDLEGCVKLAKLDSSIGLLQKLVLLNLKNCKNLIKMPDFRKVPNLEELNLEGCVKLAKLDSSIGLLQKLVSLNLKNCKNLRSIPNNVFGLSSLKDLNLFGCSKAFLNPSESALHSLYPTPKAHNYLASFLSSSLACSSYLRKLDIGFCGLSLIPDDIGCLHWLEELNLGGNNFVRLPSLKELSKLVYLNLEHCKHLTSLPELPSPSTVTEDHQYWECWRPGLYIFNCPELAEGCISKVFSWMIQFIIWANRGQSYYPFNRNYVDIIIPGSEMSSWFINQSEGHSINMDPSPIIDNNNIIGVVCCAVFSVAPYNPTVTRNEWDRTNHRWIIISVTNAKGFEGTVACIPAFPVAVDIDHLKVKSNHMWLMFFPRYYILHFLRFVNETPFMGTLNVSLCIGRGNPRVEVKNSGYRWVDKLDLQHLNLPMMHNGNSLARKRKFLTIENEAQPQHNHSSH